MLEATTWYYYNNSGNVTRVVTNEEGTNNYVAHRMDYFTNGQAVEYVMGETWTWDGDPESDPADYDVTYARQFRYDGARQRYMNRKLKLTDYSDDGTTWSDYDGDYVYGDYTISGAMPGVTITEERSFELGVGVVEDPAGTPTKEFFHGDLIGTTRHVSDVTGAKTDAVVYTAFGERVTGTNHRYGYAGAHGYQTDDSGDSPFLHVGHRYYDPATGRFLQRDPIGIRGGTNAYEYGSNSPAAFVDSDGTEPILVAGVIITGIGIFIAWNSSGCTHGAVQLQNADIIDGDVECNVFIEQHCENGWFTPGEWITDTCYINCWKKNPNHRER